MKKASAIAEAFFILFLSHHKFPRHIAYGNEIHALRQ